MFVFFVVCYIVLFFDIFFICFLCLDSVEGVGEFVIVVWEREMLLLFGGRVYTYRYYSN